MLDFDFVFIYVHNNTSHAPHAGTSGANAADLTTQASNQKSVIDGQSNDNSLQAKDLLAMAGQLVRESEEFANSREKIQAAIEAATLTKKATFGIGPKNRTIPSYDEMMDIVSHDYLSFMLDRTYAGGIDLNFSR